MRSLLDRPSVRARFAAILERSADPHLFLKAWRDACDRAYGKATQAIAAVDDGKPIVFTLKLNNQDDQDPLQHDPPRI